MPLAFRGSAGYGRAAALLPSSFLRAEPAGSLLLGEKSPASQLSSPRAGKLWYLVDAELSLLGYPPSLGPKGSAV